MTNTEAPIKKWERDTIMLAAKAFRAVHVQWDINTLAK
jgi:hypothetical protein